MALCDEIKNMRYFCSVLRILVAVLMIAASSVISANEGIVTYYHTDELGSPIASSNQYGNSRWSENYEPYGDRVENSQASTDDALWFTGKVEDSDTGLVYMNARYYDPEIGRFVSPDPVSFYESNPFSFNSYSYVNNNPYKYNDPSGEILNNIVGGFIAALQNGAIQHTEIALGLRDEFSFSELAAETSLGTLTSGLSVVKNAGKLAAIAAKTRSRTSVGPDVPIPKKETTTLFRAVSKAELDDIAQNGLRTTAGGFETGKLFATTLDDATRFGKNNFKLDGVPNFLIRVDVPNSVAQTPLRLDFMYAVSIPANQLNRLKATPINFSPLVK